MSLRAAKNPLEVPSDIEVTLKDKEISIKGKKGVLSLELRPEISIEQKEKTLIFSESKEAKNFLGMTFALVKNMMKGVSEGFEKRLELVGVGYRAQTKGKILELGLGFSHPVNYAIPEGIDISVEKQTSILVQGVDKQRVGQVSAEIRAFRPVEPYKGKGVRYSDEVVIKKEVKKK